jgi:spermidine synthase
VTVALRFVVYLLFFLSGAAALVYQVVWVRALTLVFGGSHLAVTAVLTVFMGGLAIGGFVVGKRADRVARPLRLYGLLEFGIAGSALLFAGLMRLYPALYAAMAQGRDNAGVYLTALRLLFASVALILPTILMGGTLPVLSRFVSRQPETLRSRLSLLYGFNTLGAVFGAVLGGFVLLRLYTVSTTLYIAIATNVLIGLVSLLLQSRFSGVDVEDEAVAPAIEPLPAADAPPVRLILWGIALSGFCALGYEVLWTRVLTLGVGASVYGFTIILAAFLTGLALGSKIYGVALRVLRPAMAPRQTFAWFGLTQLLIGATALLVTIYLRDVAANAVRLQHFFVGSAQLPFQARVWSGFALAFIYMIVPALFMGAAFPIAGEAVARHRRLVGRAVGDVLAANTAGAILGAAVSGLLLIRLFGIERSLQILTLVNIGTGMVILASLRKSRWLPAAAAMVTTAFIAFLAVSPDAARLWDRKYFAIYRSNQPQAFATPEMVREAVENTDVLFYSEGAESIVSVIQVKGGEKAFITNGRVEASSHLQAQQVQYTLGHLPMLLNRNPKEVLVVGLGSGMTTGATTVHPGVERVTLVEIEPRVLGVARAFGDYNHHVLDSPKLTTVFNDGRNFLMTTRLTFDVITADPIHPWFRGAGSLYSSEYFRLAAAHLKPGGVIAQWLPLYELQPRDVASVVKTFQQHFPHTMLWLTHYDAVIVGSNSPFVIDEDELERRIAEPAIADDLKRVLMGSSADLLTYFAMGTAGMQRFAASGTLNTDDRPYLEYSAPFSIADTAVMGANVSAISAQRETMLPYLKAATDDTSRREQLRRCERQLAAGGLGDSALSMFLGGNAGSPRFLQQLHRLALEYPAYAPGAFLGSEYARGIALEPRLLQQSSFALLNADGKVSQHDVSAVLVPVSPTRAAVMFVDNGSHFIYGQLYLDGYASDGVADRFANDVLRAVGAAYDGELRAARSRRQAAPPALPTLTRFKTVIGSKVQGVQPQS